MAENKNNGGQQSPKSPNWPSTTGNPSGKGRDNNPPKNGQGKPQNGNNSASK